MTFYPSLASGQQSVRQCQDAVKRLAGNNWKLIKAGAGSLAIAFATEKRHDIIQREFTDAGREDFHFVIVEVSSVVGGWIERTAYEWIEGRLARG